MPPRLFLGTLPEGILDNLASDESADAQSNTREDFFEHSPYLRYNSHAKIRTAALPSSSTELLSLVYEWTTNPLGFNNETRIINSKIRDIFVSASFTEEMEVETDTPMSGQLTQAGVVTYHLEVRGYTPVQIAAAFEIFGKPLLPEILLTGYTASTLKKKRY